MTEKEYLERQIVELQGQLDLLPATFADIKEAHERAIDDAIRKAGAMFPVRRLRSNLESEQKRLQSQADTFAAQVQVFQDLLERFHPNVVPEMDVPLPDGITHMHGIDLRPLDGETRLLVMDGNPDTIRVLGGTVPLPGVPEPEETNIEPPSFTYEADEPGEDEFGDWGDEGPADPNLDAIRSMMEQ